MADLKQLKAKPLVDFRESDPLAELTRIMGMDVDRVSVKATTSERLGFTGREEGIAAQAVATLVRA